ncbi:hypothetical protein Pf1_01125 [Flavobacterium columnare]|nr:hypothetical protein Pf1_01125 [Flavobacterium columnare]
MGFSTPIGFILLQEKEENTPFIISQKRKEYTNYLNTHPKDPRRKYFTSSSKIQIGIWKYKLYN